MRRRTARLFGREELKEAANRHDSRDATHPQVLRQIEEADVQEDEFFYDTCPDCGEPIDYCVGGHYYREEYED